MILDRAVWTRKVQKWRSALKNRISRRSLRDLQGQELSQVLRAPSRHFDPPTGAQLDRQPVVDVMLDPVYPAEIDDLRSVRPEECLRIQALFDRHEGTEDKRGIVAKVKPSVITLGLHQGDL